MPTERELAEWLDPLAFEEVAGSEMFQTRRHVAIRQARTILANWRKTYFE